MITPTFVYQRYMYKKPNCLQKRVKWHFWEELDHFYKESNNNCRQNVVFRSLLTRIIPPEIFLKVIFKTQKEVFSRIWAHFCDWKGPFLPHQHAWNHSGQRSLLQANEKSLFCVEGKFSKNKYFIVDELLTACFHEKMKTNFEFPRSFRPIRTSFCVLCGTEFVGKSNSNG